MTGLIAFLAVMMLFSVIVVKNIIDTNRKTPALPAEQWRTVAVYREDNKFKDSKAAYSFTFVLKLSNQGNRKIDASALPGCQALHILNHHRQDIPYLANIIPWVEGTLTLEELAKALPKGLTIIPVQY